MRREIVEVPVLQSGTGAGAAIDVSQWVEKAIQFFDDAGTFDGTFDIEVSLDGTHFGKAIVDISGDDIHGTESIFRLKAAYALVRTNVTLRNAGAFSGVIAGRNSRTDGG